MTPIEWTEEIIDDRPCLSCHIKDKKIKVEIINEKFNSKDWKIGFYKVDNDVYYKEWKIPKYKIFRKMGIIKPEKEVIIYLQKLVKNYLNLYDYNLDNIPEKI